MLRRAVRCGVLCCREWKFWLNRADDTSNDATVYTYVNHVFDGANPLRADIPHASIYTDGSSSSFASLPLSPPPACVEWYWYINKNARLYNTWSILKIAREMRNFQTRNVFWMHRHASLYVRRVLWYSARNIAIDKEIDAKGRIRISLHFISSHFFTGYIMCDDSRFKKKKEEKNRRLRLCDSNKPLSL